MISLHITDKKNSELLLNKSLTRADIFHSNQQLMAQTCLNPSASISLNKSHKRFDQLQTVLGHFQSIKPVVLLNLSLITGDKTDFLSPMMFSN